MKNKERIFRFTALVFPVAFFVLLELVLRSLNYGGDLSLFREVVVNGKTCYAINPDVTRRYFRTYQVRAMHSNDFFEKEKGADTWRVFCLGESSTLGYPYFFNGSFPSMLRDRLETLWPEKKIEVINLGITAVSSYTVLDFVKELTSYKPDAVLIYCGHNEFYGALGIGSVESLGQSRWAIKAYLALQEWRTFRLVRDGLIALKGMVGSSPIQSRDATIMEGMARNREIAYGSAEYKSGVKNFKANLEEIIQVSAGNRIPVVLGTLVSNLNGMEPFVSSFSENTGEKEREEWERLVQEGKKALEEKSYAGAVKSLNEAIAVDSLPARAHFVLGQALERNGRAEESLKQYRLARDLDALRFRAPSEFNTIIREAGRDYKVPVADCEALIESHSDRRIIGNRFVLEHVHLSVDGYFLLAKAFTVALAENGVLAPRNEWKLEKDLPDAVYRARVGVTPFDSVAAAIRLHVLMNSWPFRESGVTVHDFPAQTDLEKLAKAYLVREVTWEEAHVRLAERYESQGELNLAAAEYQALAKATPYNPSPYLRLGKVLLKAEQTTEAEEAFRRALHIEEGYHGHHNLGVLQLNQQKFQKAIADFQSALRFASGVDDAAISQTRYLLAVAQASDGQLAEAYKTASALLASHPQIQPVRELCDRIEQSLKRSTGKNP